MMTQTCARASNVRSKTRAAWAREGGACVRYSTARVRRALRARQRAGWVPVIPPGRSVHERITVLRRGHALATIARAYLAGTRWFERQAVEDALGRQLDTRQGAAALAAAGFALLRLAGGRRDGARD